MEHGTFVLGQVASQRGKCNRGGFFRATRVDQRKGKEGHAGIFKTVTGANPDLSAQEVNTLLRPAEIAKRVCQLDHRARTSLLVEACDEGRTVERFGLGFATGEIIRRRLLVKRGSIA